MTPEQFERWLGRTKTGGGHTNMNNKGPLSMRVGMEHIYYKYHHDQGVRLRARYRPNG